MSGQVQFPQGKPGRARQTRGTPDRGIAAIAGSLAGMIGGRWRHRRPSPRDLRWRRRTCAHAREWMAAQKLTNVLATFKQRVAYMEGGHGPCRMR